MGIAAASAQSFSDLFTVTYEGNAVENGATITSDHWDEASGWYHADVLFTPKGNPSSVTYHILCDYTDMPTYLEQVADMAKWGNPSVCWGPNGNCETNTPPQVVEFKVGPDKLGSNFVIEVQFHLIGQDGEMGPDFNPLDPSTWPKVEPPTELSKYAFEVSAVVDGKAIADSFKYDVLVGNGDNAVEGIGADEVPAVYYDLQGRRVVSPAKGQLVIERRGAKAAKVIK